MNILIVEDDFFTAKYVIDGFVEFGGICTHASNAKEALSYLDTTSFDVVILDRMLPDRNGLEVLQDIKKLSPSTPVIIVTSLGSINDRVFGLNSGADDYLVKPFSFSELHARIRSLLRRQSPIMENSVLRAGEINLNVLNRQVTRRGIMIDLNPTEFKLLEYLVKNAGTVVTKKMLLENIWNFHFDPKTSIVETHISRLRGKVNYGFETEVIQTIRGAGYKIDV